MALEGQDPATGVRTEVRRHPDRSGWCVHAVVTTMEGSILFTAHDDWVLFESAEMWQRDYLDPRIQAALDALPPGGDAFAAIDELDCLKRQPAPWHPEQFDPL